MKKKLAAYYSILGIITTCLIAYTIFVGSLFIRYGYQIKQLTIKKNNLEQIHDALFNQLSQETTALNARDYAQIEGFEPINEVITISE